MTQVTIDKNNGNVMKEEDKKLSENSSSEDEKTQRELTEDMLRKIFKDLYPTSIHKTKYINENTSLKMLALTKGLTGKNAKKEDIDDFLVKQVPKIPKSLKQLGIDWIENKKALKIDSEKLTAETITLDELKDITKDVEIEDFETYCYLIQPDINDKVFDLIKELREEILQKQIESGELDSGRVKELEERVRELESKLSDSEAKQKEEMNSFRQNYEIEKEKFKSKLEQKLETTKNKYEEEKQQLVKIQADSDKRFAEERKVYLEKIEVTEKENKKYQERINSIGYDLSVKVNKAKMLANL